LQLLSLSPNTWAFTKMSCPWLTIPTTLDAHLAAIVRDPTCDPWDQNLGVNSKGFVGLGSFDVLQSCQTNRNIKLIKQTL